MTASVSIGSYKHNKKSNVKPELSPSVYARAEFMNYRCLIVQCSVSLYGRDKQHVTSLFIADLTVTARKIQITF